MSHQTRRQFLSKTLTSAVGISLFNITHSWSKDAHFNGEAFDAGGQILKISGWGGFWEKLMRRLVFDKFEKDYNCKIVYDSAFPWGPKYLASPPKDPQFILSNWNLPEMFTVAEKGDYFLEQDQIIANLPNIKDCWPFALSNGVGITWSFARLCYGYHNSLKENAPKDFKSFWDHHFNGKRISVIPQNDIFKGFFMSTCVAYGKSQRDMQAGIEAIKELSPLKQLNFSRDVALYIEQKKAQISIQADAEMFTSMLNGANVDFLLWEGQKTILTQTKTISKYASHTEKMLSFALLNQIISANFFEKFIQEFPMRPMNAKVKIPEKLEQFGIHNDFAETDGLWIPNWVWWQAHEREIQAAIKHHFVDA